MRNPRTRLRQNRLIGITWTILACIIAILLAALVFANLPPALFSVALIASLAVARIFHNRGKRHRVLLADEIRKKDARPPVTYLRSFKGERSLNSQEQILARIFTDVGPLIAIGRPGENLPLLGASRMYVADDDWQATVQRFIAESRLTIIRIDQTDGLLWEVKHAINNCRPEQVALLVPPQGSAYDAFKATADTFLRWPLPPNPYKKKAQRAISGVVYFLDDWTPEIVPLRAPFSRNYDQDAQFKYAFQPAFDRLGLPWWKSRPSFGALFFMLLFLVIPITPIAVLLPGYLNYLAGFPITPNTLGALALPFAICIALGILFVAKRRDAAYWRTRARLPPAGARQSNQSAALTTVY